MLLSPGSAPHAAAGGADTDGKATHKRERTEAVMQAMKMEAVLPTVTIEWRMLKSVSLIIILLL